jgi:hypothetical protein
MDTLKKLFYFTYALVALVIIGILFFNVSLSEMLGAEGTTTFWMTVALLLLGMLTVGVVGDYLETRSLAKKVGKLNKENTDLKAQLFEHMNRSSINGNPTSSSASGSSWLNRIGLGGKSDLPNQPNTDH